MRWAFSCTFALPLVTIASASFVSPIRFEEFRIAPECTSGLCLQARTSGALASSPPFGQERHRKAATCVQQAKGETNEHKVVADSLMAWLSRNGAELNGVSLETGGAHGLGLMATEDLGVGHPALLIPRRAQLLADSKQLHAASRALSEQAAELLVASSNAAVATSFEEGALAAALLSELSLLQGTSRKWKLGLQSKESIETPSHYAEYLEWLPSLNDMPRPAWLWSEGEANSFSLAPTLQETQGLRQQVDEEYAALASAGATALSSGEVVTKELWDYGRVLVMSRCFDVGDGLAMLPGIDAANHCEDALLEIFVDDDGELGSGAHAAVLLVDRDVAAGDEVFLSYGRKSNADLLLRYGFSLAP